MSSPKFEKAYALLIGTGANTSGQLDNAFKSTINDANWLREILVDGSRCAYKPDQVKTLIGEKATQDNIFRELRKIARIADTESTVIIFFSGHGGQDELGKTFLIPYGYDGTEDAADYAINNITFAEHLEKIKVQKLVVLINCCYAAGIHTDSTPQKLSLDKEEELGLKNLLLDEAQINKLKEGRGFAIMTSSLATEVSYTGYTKDALSNERYSAFTIGIGRALTGVGKSKPGYVYIRELTKTCRQFVEGKTKDKQHPYYKVDGDDFPIAYFHGHLSSAVSKLGDDFTVNEPGAQEPAPPVPAWPSFTISNINNSQGGAINSGTIYNVGGQHSLNFGSTFGGPVPPNN